MTVSDSPTNFKYKHFGTVCIDMEARPKKIITQQMKL